MNRKWARNIRTFLKPGRKTVCKVLDVDKNSGYINLSTRRVGASQAKTKQDNWSKEKRANDFLITLSKSSKVKYEIIFKKIGDPILDKYGSIYPFLEQIVINDSIIKELNLDKKLSSQLVDAVKARIKLKKARVRGILNLQSQDSNGLEVVKKTLQMLQSVVKKADAEVEIKYLGAPKYQIVFESTNLKRGESDLNEALKEAGKYIEKNKGSLRFQKVVA